MNVKILTTRVDDLDETVGSHGQFLDGLEDLPAHVSAALRQPDTTTGAPDADARSAGHEQPRDHPDAAATGGEGAAGPAPRRSAVDLDELACWVHDNIAALIERKVRGRVDAGPHWCPEWWRHPEAVLRFEALRRAWETLVTDDGLGLITYIGHLDHTLNFLMADAGPFHAGSCKHDRHVTVTVLGDHPPHRPDPPFDGVDRGDPWPEIDHTTRHDIGQNGTSPSPLADPRTS